MVEVAVEILNGNEDVLCATGVGGRLLRSGNPLTSENSRGANSEGGKQAGDGGPWVAGGFRSDPGKITPSPGVTSHLLKLP